MIFVGIVIFTVYTTHTVSVVGRCDSDEWTVCSDYMLSEQREIGGLKPRYIGEFSSVDACQKAAAAIEYKPSKGERVDKLTEVLCVQKKIDASAERR